MQMRLATVFRSRKCTVSAIASHVSQLVLESQCPFASVNLPLNSQSQHEAEDPAIKTFCEANHQAMLYFSDVTTQDFLDRAPMCDLFVAGFPCQPFSYAGLRAGEDDQRGRGCIVWFLVAYIRKQLPQAIILENVKGLLDLHPQTLLNVIEALSKIVDPSTARRAYHVCWSVLNSKDFSLPQVWGSALRVFLRFATRTPPARFSCEWVIAFLVVATSLQLNTITSHSTCLQKCPCGAVSHNVVQLRFDAR